MHKSMISGCSVAAVVAGLWMGSPARAQYQSSNYVPPTNSNAVVQADMRVTDAEARITQARNQASAAKSAVSDLQAEIQGQQGQIASVSARIQQSQQALSALQSAAEHWSGELHTREMALDQAMVRCHADRMAVDQALADDGKPIDRSDGYVAANQAIEKAKDDLHLAESAATQRLTATREYSEAYHQWELADQRLQALRKNPAAGAELDEATRQWEAARKQMDDLRAHALSSDLDVRSARERLTQAESNMDACRLSQQRGGASSPRSAAAIRELTDAQHACEQAIAAVHEVQAKAASAQSDYQKQIDGINYNHKIIVAIQADIASLQQELAIQQAAVARANEDVNRATAVAQTAQHDREAAIDATESVAARPIYGPAPAMIDGPAPYAGPPVVSVEPPVYAPPPPLFSARVDLGGLRIGGFFVHPRFEYHYSPHRRYEHERWRRGERR